jgi:hypothetical protein
MAKGSIGAHRFSIMCATVVVVSLGWAPSQAFALDPPIDPAPVTTAVTPVVSAATSTTSDPVETITNTVSNTAPNPVDTVSNATSDPVDTVTNTISNTAPNPVDPVSNTVSGATDPVSNTVSGATDPVSNTVSGATDPVSSTASGAVGTVSNTASGAVGTASGAGGTLKSVNGATGAGTVAGVGPVETSSTPQAGQLSAMAGWSPRLPSGALDVNRIGDEGHATCVAGVGTACQSLEGTGGSWTRSVADIIRKLLALTGMSALALFVLACSLTLAGAVALYQSRDRSKLGSA